MRVPFAALAVAATFVALPMRASAQENVYDPYENFNRHLFAVHEGIDKAVLEPVARGYRAITPRPVRSGVSNFLSNLDSPVIFANDVLQGQFHRAGVTAARFGVNTTIGVLGIFDPARRMGLEHHDEDFGQTLAVWGVKSGPYFFVPLLGPTNLRDGIGRVVDVGLDPLTWARFHHDDEAKVTRVVAVGVSSREALLDEVDDLRQTSLDPYVTIRTAYGLLRYSAIQNGREDATGLPRFEDNPPDDAAPPAMPPAPEAPIGGPNGDQDRAPHPTQTPPVTTSGAAPSSPLTTGAPQ